MTTQQRPDTSHTSEQLDELFQRLDNLKAPDLWPALEGVLDKHAEISPLLRSQFGYTEVQTFRMGLLATLLDDAILNPGDTDSPEINFALSRKTAEFMKETVDRALSGAAAKYLKTRLGSMLNPEGAA